MTKKCLVKECRGVRKDGKPNVLFTFPKSVDLQRQWLQRCGYLDHDISDLKPYMLNVCSKHFAEEDCMERKSYKKRWIKDDAVPKLFLALEYYDAFDQSGGLNHRIAATEERANVATELVVSTYNEIAYLKSQVSDLKYQVSLLKRQVETQRARNTVVIVQQPTEDKDVVHVFL